MKILFVYGTRPEAIKMAPIVARLRTTADLQPIVCVTGQHREMLDQVNALFDIVPDSDLDVIRPRQSLTHVTTAVLSGMESVLQEAAPAALVVQGDTSTTFTAALAATYAQVPVVHVEAGLRTGHLYNPFPEEVNRRLTTHVTSLHLAPTATSKQNLLREGVDPSTVVVTGNSVIDAMYATLAKARPIISPALQRVVASERPWILVTAHRRESWGTPMQNIAAALRALAQANPEVQILFPIHRNPVVRQDILPFVEDLQNVIVTEPLDYTDFVRAMQTCYLVLTDSGGVQEEAPALGKPVLVLRDNTERPEAVEAGTVALVGTATAAIVTKAQQLITSAEAYGRMANAVNPYGDGQAARRTELAIRHFLSAAAPPADEFVPPIVG